MPRDYAAEAAVLVPIITRVIRGSTIVFYGAGDAVLECEILNRLKVPITHAIFVDRRRIPDLSPVRDIEMVSLTVPEATLHIERTGCAVGAMVACGFQINTSHGVVDMDLVWRYQLISAVEQASVTGLMVACGADTPFVSYYNATINAGESPESFMKSITVEPCQAVATRQAKLIMDSIRFADASYRARTGHAMFPWAIDREALPTILVANICTRMGADMVNAVAGNDEIGTSVKRIMNTLSYPRIDSVHTRMRTTTTARWVHV